MAIVMALTDESIWREQRIKFLMGVGLDATGALEEVGAARAADGLGPTATGLEQKVAARPQIGNSILQISVISLLQAVRCAA